MTRTSILSLALIVVAGAVESPAAAPIPVEKEGFRVYTISPRCGQRLLTGVYPSAREALGAAAKLGKRVEVTTGSEGKNGPGEQARLFHIYTKVCDKSGWQRETILVDQKQAEETVKARQKKGENIEIITDHAPKEVFQVFGGGCSRSWRLIGTYVSARDALEAAEDVRNVKKLRNCLVTSGTRNTDYWGLGKPTEYQVFVKYCRSGWRPVEVTKDEKKSQEIFAKWKKDGRIAEQVQHYPNK